MPTPRCLPGRTHVSVITDIGVPFLPRVRATCEVCGKTWEYPTQTPEQAQHIFHKTPKRAVKPEFWHVVDTPAHIQRMNRNRGNAY